MAVKPKADEAQLKFRVDQDLREQLEKSAEAKGISLNKEITDRLRRSFAESGPAVDLAEAGKPIFGLLRVLGVAMEACGSSALFTRTHSWDIAKDMNWLDDRFAYDQAVVTATTMLQAFRPKQTLDEPVKSDMHDGIFWAEFFLKQIASGRPNVPENGPRIDALKKYLGNLIDRASEMATIDPGDRASARFLKSKRESSQ